MKVCAPLTFQHQDMRCDSPRSRIVGGNIWENKFEVEYLEKTYIILPVVGGEVRTLELMTGADGPTVGKIHYTPRGGMIWHGAEPVGEFIRDQDSFRVIPIDEGVFAYDREQKVDPLDFLLNVVSSADSSR